MTTITKERLQWLADISGRDDIDDIDGGEIRELARIALALLEREQVRREHAEWSDKTFGNVGPVGPLKHLSKEALEAAADPSDPLEWADMQFLLWDAQRRMGISDEFITRAMIEKLEINKSRQWPEPKDGEPRLHIKEQPAPVIPDGWISCSERMPEDEQEVIVHNKLGYRYVSYFDEHSGLFFDMRGGNQMNCIEHILVTHWMPLPAAPEPEQS
ncbi:TPA: dATP/dGTP pyrophosphohydrolase domain-containing protein [Salmonella enterica]